MLLTAEEIEVLVGGRVDRRRMIRRGRRPGKPLKVEIGVLGLRRERIRRGARVVTVLVLVVAGGDRGADGGDGGIKGEIVRRWCR